MKSGIRIVNNKYPLINGELLVRKRKFSFRINS